MGIGLGRYLFNKKWRKKNTNNLTTAGSVFDISCVKVGRNTYGKIFVLENSHQHKLSIGNYCSIAPEVCFILDSEHPTHNISTYPFKVKVCGEKFETHSKGDIIVDDDVWIGYGATIMSGVHIGQGAVVAAGSVVTKEVPPYAICGGVPARVIKYRFEQELITELLKVDYSKLDKTMIEQNQDKLYEKLVSVKQLEWLPKK